MSEIESWEVAIIGGGAAGLMCAIAAGCRGRRVVVLEHQERVGKKILISGGGRCNFTNLGATWENYQSAQPNFAKSALARYTPWDFLALVERHRISYHEKKLGQQFCDQSSRQIVELLRTECAEARVVVRENCRVLEVSKPERFRLQTSQGTLEAESLVIATGGLSFPKLGATDFGHRVARQFGLAVTPLRPGLVPLTLRDAERGQAEGLSGVSLEAEVTHGGQTFTENLLFTHRGLSGPAILQASSYWREGEPMHFNLLPHTRAETLWARSRRGASVDGLLAEHLPRRFVEQWVSTYTPPKTVAQWTKAEEAHATANLHQWTVHPSGTEGYAKAEVTVGGVDTRELSSRTLEARKVPGLHFIGEVVDVTGWLGGYNFQWAWASGDAAGQAV